MSEYIPTLGVIRYRCPLDACPWVHDDPTYGPSRLVVDRNPTTGELDISGAINKQIAERDQKIENIMREHLATHAVDEWAKQIHDMRAKQELLEAELRRALTATRLYDPAEIERLMGSMRKPHVHVTGLDR
jgi:hypothetical protein